MYKSCTKTTGEHAPAKGLNTAAKWCLCNNKGIGDDNESFLGQMNMKSMIDKEKCSFFRLAEQKVV